MAQLTAPYAEPHESWIRVFFGEGTGISYADYHYVWLRHNCERDRHPKTKERILCPSKIPANIRPRWARISEDTTHLVILWDEGISGHESRYRLDWLQAHAYAPERGDVPPPDSSIERVEVRATSFADPARLRDVTLDLVKRFGVAVVRGYGLETESLIELYSGAGLTVRGTHFGRIEDLRTDNTTNQNTDQLGYTDSPVELHTDQPFLEQPPEFQVLQCMRPAHQGGENYLVDAEQVSNYLLSQDAPAHELLTTVSVRFHRKQQSFEKVLASPILAADSGRRFLVRYSYFTLSPFNVPFHLMEPWYRAYKRFADLVNDPKHQYRLALQSGDYVIYNNRRMLHARTGFTGPRWMRGIYFDYPEALAATA